MPSIADDDITEMYRAFSWAFADRRCGFDCISVFIGAIVRQLSARFFKQRLVGAGYSSLIDGGGAGGVAYPADETWQNSPALSCDGDGGNNEYAQRRF